jgi:hypothetical protein
MTHPWKHAKARATQHGSATIKPAGPPIAGLGEVNAAQSNACSNGTLTHLYEPLLLVDALLGAGLGVQEIDERLQDESASSTERVAREINLQPELPPAISGAPAMFGARYGPFWSCGRTRSRECRRCLAPPALLAGPFGDVASLKLNRAGFVTSMPSVGQLEEKTKLARKLTTNEQRGRRAKSAIGGVCVAFFLDRSCARDHTRLW